MSPKTSRTLLILEAILIGAPVTLFALIYSCSSISSLLKFPNLPYVVALAILALFSLLAISSGWRLFAAFLQGGTEKLQRQHTVWWVMIGIGIVLLFGSILSRLFPPSPEYSFWWSFRLDFEIFALCTPVLIPLCHLTAERVLRRP
jgi:hypothetical protein